MRSRCLAPCLLSVLLSPVLEAASSSPQLTPRDKEILDRVSLAWFQGDPRTALEQFSPLVNRLNPEQVEAADKLLAERSMPSVGQVLSDARKAFVQQGFADELPKAQVGEAARVLPILAAEVESILRSAKSTKIFAEPLPILSTIQQYEDVLWESHVLSNRLQNARSLAAYVARLAKNVPRTQIIAAPENQKAVFARDFNDLITRLDSQLQELAEREIELRLWRLKLARELLAQPALTPEKLLAAHASQLDARLIEEFFQERKGRREKFLRPDLNEPDVARWAAEDAKEATRLAGDLQTKAQMLFEGLHWWLRGRYGMGPEVFGLAKSREAMVSPAAQFGLYMPTSFSKPTDPMAVKDSRQAIPVFDRRHHYWWAWEDRKVMRESNSFTESTGGSVYREKLTTTQFW